MAQKEALILWRDRKSAPGIAARFTKAGATYYGFTPRSTKYNKRKGGLPDFTYTGKLREMLHGRKPRSITAGNSDMAVTRLAYGGGALNFDFHEDALPRHDRGQGLPAHTQKRQVSERPELCGQAPDQDNQPLCLDARLCIRIWRVRSRPRMAHVPRE